CPEPPPRSIRAGLRVDYWWCCVALLQLRAGLVQLLGKAIERCPNLAIASHGFASRSGLALVVVVRIEPHECGCDRLAHLRDTFGLEGRAEGGDGAIVAAACEQLRGDGAHAAIAVAEVLQRARERLVLVAVLQDGERIHPRCRIALAGAGEHCAELVDALRL